MADVQLEHGYVAIANRLYEAVLQADFRDAHLRIVLALIRVTYGWRQRSVQLPSGAQLARFARLDPNGGGFRRAFAELSASGVVHSYRNGTVALQKDYTRWGVYSVAQARLESLFGDRPDAGAVPPVHPRQDDVHPRQDDVHPRQDEVGVVSPLSVRLTAPERHRKTVKDNVITAAAQHFGDESALTDASTETGADPATVLVVAANCGITERYGEQPAPLRASAGSSIRAVEELQEAHVPVIFARDAMYTAAKHCNLDRPPKSIRYLVPAVVEAWTLDAQRRAAEALPPPSEFPGRMNGRPSAAMESTEDAYRRAAVELDAQESSTPPTRKR